MDARDRRAALTEPRPTRRAVGAWATATIFVASLAWGCGTQPVPSATTAPSASPAAATPVATPAPTASPTPAYADTLRVGWNPAGLLPGGSTPAVYAFRGLPFEGTPSISFASVVYSGLYRYDAHYSPVPDLADGPCVPQADPKVIRCRITETAFHDGTPLTAEDVAYTYRLFSAKVTGGLWTGSLKQVRVVDPRTVDFVLSAVDPTFLTSVLPTVPILPRNDVETAYADFATATKDLTAAGLQKLVDTIGEELGRDPPVCSPRLDEVDALLAKLGAHPYREDFANANGTFDACAYMQTASDEIAYVASALDHTGLDAEQQALMFFAALRPPVGTGPYRFVSEDADRVHLEAWPGYHGGVAATRYLDFVPAKTDGSDLVDGSLDISQGGANVGSASRTTATAQGVLVAMTPQTGFYDLFFNVRPGRLFADLALRKALQLCIDLPRDVEAATGGTGTPIYGPVLPGTWAYDPQISGPSRDVAAARKLIEGAGWQLGTDAIYAKDGVRLAAPIVVRVARPDRIKMADLIALQARDCGMDLQSLPTSFDDILAMLGHYPFDIPGTDTPFDLYVGGFDFAPDPAAVLSLFISSQVTDAEHADPFIYVNYAGFSDPAFDRLVEAGSATYDQAERTQILRRAQEELASQQPVIFLWVESSTDFVRSAVTTVNGPLDLAAPNWAWQPERLVVLK